jgi:hypothetical protein
MMAKGSFCSDCNWSEDGAAISGEGVMDEFRHRHSRSNRNHAIAMICAMVLGFFSLVIAGLWYLVIYRGSAVALVLIGLLTVISAVLGFILTQVKKLFPTALHCPSCEARIDVVAVGDHCPSCRIRLR